MPPVTRRTGKAAALPEATAAAALPTRASTVAAAAAAAASSATATRDGGGTPTRRAATSRTAGGAPSDPARDASVAAGGRRTRAAAAREAVVPPAPSGADGGATAGVSSLVSARAAAATAAPLESENEIRPVRSSPRGGVTRTPTRGTGGGTGTITGRPPAGAAPATPHTPAASSVVATPPGTTSIDGSDTPAAEPDDLFLPPSASASDGAEDGVDPDDDDDDGSGSSDDDKDDGSLFGLLLRRPAALSSVAAQWHERIVEDGPGSVAQVLSLVARSAVPLSAGAPVPAAAVSPAAVVADAPADTAVELTTALAAACATVAGGRGGGGSGGAVLPFSRRTAQARRYALAYTTFFSRLVTTAPDEVLYDIDAFDTLLAWLVALAASRLRPLRQAATAAAYAVLDGVLELRAALRATTAALQTSLAAAGRTRGGATAASASAASAATAAAAAAAAAAADGGGGISSSSNGVAAGRAAVAEDMRRKVARAGVKDKDLASLGDHVWRGIVQSSYRDVAAPVRVATVEALARWAAAYPSVYLSDERLKYLGWLLNDPAPAVRGAAVGALTRLFSDADLAGSLDEFAGRFGGRIVEMGLDVDAGVAEAALRLAAVVRRLGLGPAAGDGQARLLGASAAADVAEEEGDPLAAAVYQLAVSAAPAGVRRAAGAFIAAEFGADAAEGAIDRPASAGVVGGAASAAAVAASADVGGEASGGGGYMDDLRELVVSVLPPDTTGPVRPTRLLDAVWPVLPAVRCWSAYVALLLEAPPSPPPLPSVRPGRGRGTTGVAAAAAASAAAAGAAAASAAAEPLSDAEKASLAWLVAAATERVVTDDAAGRGRDDANLLPALTATIVPALPRLLSHFQADAAVLAPLAKLPELLSAGLGTATDGDDGSMAGTVRPPVVAALRDALGRHGGDGRVLRAAAGALATLASGESDMLASPAVAAAADLRAALIAAAAAADDADKGGGGGGGDGGGRTDNGVDDSGGPPGITAGGRDAAVAPRLAAALRRVAALAVHTPVGGSRTLDDVLSALRLVVQWLPVATTTAASTPAGSSVSSDWAGLVTPAVAAAVALYTWELSNLHAAVSAVVELVEAGRLRGEAAAADALRREALAGAAVSPQRGELLELLSALGTPARRIGGVASAVVAPSPAAALLAAEATATVLSTGGRAAAAMATLAKRVRVSLVVTAGEDVGETPGSAPTDDGVTGATADPPPPSPASSCGHSGGDAAASRPPGAVPLVEAGSPAAATILTDLATALTPPSEELAAAVAAVAGTTAATFLSDPAAVGTAGGGAAATGGKGAGAVGDGDGAADSCDGGIGGGSPTRLVVALAQAAAAGGLPPAAAYLPLLCLRPWVGRRRRAPGAAAAAAAVAAPGTDDAQDVARAYLRATALSSDARAVRITVDALGGGLAAADAVASDAGRLLLALIRRVGREVPPPATADGRLAGGAGAPGEAAVGSAAASRTLPPDANADADADAADKPARSRVARLLVTAGVPLAGRLTPPLATALLTALLTSPAGAPAAAAVAAAAAAVASGGFPLAVPPACASDPAIALHDALARVVGRSGLATTAVATAGATVAGRSAVRQPPDRRRRRPAATAAGDDNTSSADSKSDGSGSRGGGGGGSSGGESSTSSADVPWRSSRRGGSGGRRGGVRRRRGSRRVTTPLAPATPATRRSTRTPVAVRHYGAEEEDGSASASTPSSSGHTSSSGSTSGLDDGGGGGGGASSDSGGNGSHQSGERVAATATVAKTVSTAMEGVTQGEAAPAGAAVDAPVGGAVGDGDATARAPSSKSMVD
ncbi:hypothetical protein MMPV_002242 [Pyropia vietnamensis]